MFLFDNWFQETFVSALKLSGTLEFRHTTNNVCCRVTLKYHYMTDMSGYGSDPNAH